MILTEHGTVGHRQIAAQRHRARDGEGAGKSGVPRRTDRHHNRIGRSVRRNRVEFIRPACRRIGTARIEARHRAVHVNAEFVGGIEKSAVAADVDARSKRRRARDGKGAGKRPIPRQKQITRTVRPARADVERGVCACKEMRRDGQRGGTQRHALRERYRSVCEAAGSGVPFVLSKVLQVLGRKASRYIFKACAVVIAVDAKYAHVSCAREECRLYNKRLVRA